jgi:hypothetical protein
MSHFRDREVYMGVGKRDAEDLQTQGKQNKKTKRHSPSKDGASRLFVDNLRRGF